MIKPKSDELPNFCYQNVDSGLKLMHRRD